MLFAQCPPPHKFFLSRFVLWLIHAPLYLIRLAACLSFRKASRFALSLLQLETKTIQHHRPEASFHRIRHLSSGIFRFNTVKWPIRDPKQCNFFLQERPLSSLLYDTTFSRRVFPSIWIDDALGMQWWLSAWLQFHSSALPLNRGGGISYSSLPTSGVFGLYV